MTERASSGSPVTWATAAEPGHLLRREVELEEGGELAVPVLLHHVDPVVGGHEVVHRAGERPGPHPEVVGLEAGLGAELVLALADGRVGRAVGDDADAGAARCRAARAAAGPRGRRSNLAESRSMFRGEDVGALAVGGVLVVPGTAGEVGRLRVVGAGQRAPADAVAVDVLVPGEPAQPLQLLLAEHLAAIEGPVGVGEGLGHPVVHAQVEVGEDEDRGLEALGHVEGLDREREALLHRAGQEQDLLGVAVGEERRRDHVALGGAGGEPGGRPDPLHVEDHAGDLGVVAEPGELAHERDSRAARGGHGPCPGPAGARAPCPWRRARPRPARPRRWPSRRARAGTCGGSRRASPPATRTG